MPSGDLRLGFELCADWNNSLSLRIQVIFYGVRNRAQVEAALLELRAGVTGGTRLAEVVALRRTAEGSFLVESSRGCLAIEAASFAEL